jgi:PAS domain S-box-containing protein
MTVNTRNHVYTEAKTPQACVETELAMFSAAQAFEQIQPKTHLVQLYEADESVLTANVSHYLWDGLKRGESVLVIATPEHRASFSQQLQQLGADPDSVEREGRLVVLDAQSALDMFMVEGRPDWNRFESVVVTLLGQLHAKASGAGLRAYGEMVGVLWKAGQYSAAMLVEEFWNKALTTNSFNLYCAYPIDVFGTEFHSKALHRLLCAHTHLVPTGENGYIENALDRAMQEVLGPDRLRDFKQATPQSSWAAMPDAEATILSLRSEAPDVADEVLSRARQHYRGERRFRALIENSSDVISLLDAEGQIQYASASVAKILEYGPDELVGRGVFELIHPDNREEALRSFKEMLARPRCPVLLQTRMQKKSGTWCWIESTGSNLLSEADLQAIVLNFRDISERKAAEKKKQEDAEKLARSNAELQAFAYAAAHDLKEPLRTVCAFTQLLIRGIELDDKRREFAEHIVSGVTRMSNLLDDLLSLTSLSFSDPPLRVELRDAIEAAITNLRLATDESGARVTIGSLPAAWGNESHLIELFQNLIDNAIKYRSDAPIEIHVSAEPHPGKWLVKVRDNGIGIAPEHHDRIFGLFKRLDSREVPGTGIGLAICKKIVGEMGGKIWVESEPGKGSTFCFTIPVAA